MSTVLWLLVLMGFYPYLVYPVAVAIAARLRRRTVYKDDQYLPEVTIIIAAFNEARCIEATVRNKLNQDYPRERLRVVVVSDESTDATDTIVAGLATLDGRVKLLRQVPRQGKTAALNLALSQVTSDIVAFSDANSLYADDAVRRLVRNFADPDVGYVTGKMTYLNEEGLLVGDGCDAFMRYENRLRSWETQCGSIVGADGGIDAVRRELYTPMRPDQLPDFVLPLSVVAQGSRVVFEPSALLYEESLTGESAEFRMRVRVALRAFWALWDMRQLMNPRLTGLFSWQLVSHKLLRYLSFLPLLGAAILNLMLLSEGQVYKAMAVGQVVFLMCVLVAAVAGGASSTPRLARYCFYFLLLNAASALAFAKFLRGEKQVIWKPRVG